MTIIDSATSNVIATVALGKRPRGIHASPDRKTIYVASFNAAAGTLETVCLDVGDQPSIAAAAAEVKLRLRGRGLDGLFNNAGIGSISPVEHTSLDTLRDIFEINVFGQIATIQAFLPLIRLAK
jgi:NAD(P)-dependent dehydrogenase (short-subunit alcohol dehydrogenase family)